MQPSFERAEYEAKQPVHGGHMHYERYVHMTEGVPRFVKAHHAEYFTDSTKEQHSREYLNKEHVLYRHLEHAGFAHLPQDVSYHNNELAMEALLPANDWHWRAPGHEADRYTEEVINALQSLHEVAPPSSFYDSAQPSHITHIEEGWQALEQTESATVTQHLLQHLPLVHPHFRSALNAFANDYDLLVKTWRETALTDDQFLLCHHDARQANIAWHPEHGVRIVDWSWAGYGLPNADVTSFLIDLHKSGHRIDSHLECVNNTHSFIQAGFLLGHSLWPASPHSKTVRQQQLISAISAYDIWRTTS